MFNKIRWSTCYGYVVTLGSHAYDGLEEHVYNVFVYMFLNTQFIITHSSLT